MTYIVEKMLYLEEENSFYLVLITRLFTHNLVSELVIIIITLC